MAGIQSKVSDTGGTVLRRSRLARALASEVSDAIEVAEDAALAAFPEPQRPVPRDTRLTAHQSHAATVAAALAAALDAAIVAAADGGSRELDTVAERYASLQAVNDRSSGAPSALATERVVAHARAVWAEFDDSTVSWADFAETLDNRCKQGKRP